MMIRQDIVRIVDKMRIPFKSDVNVVEVAAEIQRYCHENLTKPQSHTWTVDDGVLLVDGKPLRRVGSKAVWITSGDKALYWEGRILERQEDWMD